MTQERKIDQDIAIITMTLDELRAFVRVEVRKALGDRETLDRLCDHCAARNAATLRSYAPYRPVNVEYKSAKAVDNPDLPQWAREGNW